MARKKRKTQHVDANQVVSPPKPDMLSTLPWELLAEILTMTSPEAVLSMSRCSRHFCNALVTNLRSVSIWKDVRKTCEPPIPDPTPNFTEPSYAAYIFDGGPCNECGRFTDQFYVTFALRLRFCSHKCGSAWMKNNTVYSEGHADDKAVTSWLLRSEVDYEHERVLTNPDLLQLRSFYHKTHYNQAVKEYNAFLSTTKGHTTIGNGRQLYLQLHKKDVEKKEAILDLSVRLLRWRRSSQKITHELRGENQALIRKVADREDWELETVLNSPTCSALYRRCNRALDRLTEQDISMIRSDIEAEVTMMQAKRARSKEEQAYARRRDLIARDYHRKISASSTSTILPALNVFREQPVIRAIQNKQYSTPEEVADKLKDPTVKGKIGDNLAVWKDQATTGFMNILGVEQYTKTSANKLHPVDRLTARFICSKCLQRSSGKGEMSPLDFKAACIHRCPCLTKKQKSKASWSPDQFEVDNKAIQVTRKLLALLNVSEEDKESVQATTTAGDRILCKKCDGGVLMNFKTLQLHSHRHEDMEIELLSPHEVARLRFQPIKWGLCSELMSRAKSAPRKAELRKYGCRHCLRREGHQQQEDAVQRMDIDGEKSSSRNTAAASKQPKLMSFNGMRCHLLRSHGNVHIADEDIYRIDNYDRGPNEDDVPPVDTASS